MEVGRKNEFLRVLELSTSCGPADRLKIADAGYLVSVWASLITHVSFYNPTSFSLSGMLSSCIASFVNNVPCTFTYLCTCREALNASCEQQRSRIMEDNDRLKKEVARSEQAKCELDEEISDLERRKLKLLEDISVHSNRLNRIQQETRIAEEKRHGAMNDLSSGEWRSTARLPYHTLFLCFVVLQLAKLTMMRTCKVTVEACCHWQCRYPVAFLSGDEKHRNKNWWPNTGIISHYNKTFTSKFFLIGRRGAASSAPSQQPSLVAPVPVSAGAMSEALASAMPRAQVQ